MRNKIERGYALGDYLLMTILVVAGIVITLALFGLSIDDAWDMTIGELDRSISGVTGGSVTVNTTYRPAAVAVISPTGGTHIESGIASFSWAPNTEADAVDRYRVTVQHYFDLGVVSFWAPMGTKISRCGLGVGCSGTQMPIPLGGTYRWKVQAHNGAGWGSSTGFHYFYSK